MNIEELKSMVTRSAELKASLDVLFREYDVMVVLLQSSRSRLKRITKMSLQGNAHDIAEMQYYDLNSWLTNHGLPETEETNEH